MHIFLANTNLAETLTLNKYFLKWYKILWYTLGNMKGAQT